MLETSTVLSAGILPSNNTCREEGDLGHFITDNSATLGLLIRNVRHFEIKELVILLGGTVQGIGSPTVTPNVRMPMAATTRSTERYEYVHSMATLSLVMPVSSR